MRVRVQTPHRVPLTHRYTNSISLPLLVSQVTRRHQALPKFIVGLPLLRSLYDSECTPVCLCFSSPSLPPSLHSQGTLGPELKRGKGYAKSQEQNQKKRTHSVLKLKFPLD